MNRHSPLARIGASTAAGLAALSAACAAEQTDEPVSQSADALLVAELAPPGWAEVTGSFVDESAEEIGGVAFAQAPDGLLMRVDLAGLGEGWHGIHLHMLADCSDGADGFKKSGAHVDPESMEHGLANAAGPEQGDLPNLYAGADGRATAEFFIAGVFLADDAAGNDSAPLADEDGFAVIIHASADDHETQPIGGAGDRVACAAIAG